MTCKKICYQNWVDMYNKKDKECYKLQLENSKLFNQYKRTYKNFDRCMKCFEDILIFCKAKGNYTIAGLIEDCLKDLEVK